MTPVDRIRAYEAGLLERLNGAEKPLLDTIRDDKQLKDETIAKVKKLLEDYTKSFSA